MAAPTAPKKKIKVRVRAETMIWNGSIRIRPGAVFDLEHEEGKPLPKCVAKVEEKEPEAVSLGKRERDTAPTNLAKEAPTK